MKNRILAYLLCVLMLVGMVPVSAFAASTTTNWADEADTSWYKAEDAEFTLTTAAQLAGLAQLVNEGNAFAGKIITLGAKIDLSGKLWTPIATNGDAANKFAGTFDGGYYTISNMTIEQGAAYHAAGLFGAIGATGVVKNFTISNANVTNLSSGDATVNGTAAVVGSMPYGGTIENVTVDTAVISANRMVGGIVGYAAGTVTGCTVKNVTLTATPDDLDNNGTYDNGDKVGGIIGYVNSGTNNFVGNKVEGTNTMTAYRDLGGLIGCCTDTTAKVENNTVKGTLSLVIDRTLDYGDKDENVSATIGRASSTVSESNTSSATTSITVPGAVAQVGTVQYATLGEAIAAANDAGTATITLLADVEFAEKYTITGNVTITGAKTLTRAADYTGTLFTVNADATLTLDGGLTIDGNNNWTFNQTAYDAALAACAQVSAADNTYVVPEAGAPAATATMMSVSGTLNLNKVAIKNHYSAGYGLVTAGTGATVNLTGATITHCANTVGSGLVVNASSGKWDVTPVIWVNMNAGTVIDDSFVGGNHGVFKIYMGTVFTMNGGEIKNTRGWNSDGVAVGVYWATFVMNGGTICSNSSVYGPNNGRNAAVYLHSNSYFTMNDGNVCHNTSRAYGGVDGPYATEGYTSSVVIKGGNVVNNVSLKGSDNDVHGGELIQITGGTFTQDVSQWCADGYACPYDAASGTYTVVVHTSTQCAPETTYDETGHWTVCSVCGDVLSELEPHTAAYKYDADSHWTACECGYVMSEAEAHSFEDGVCTVCEAAQEGYVAPSTTPEFDYVLFALAARYSQKFTVAVSAENATVSGNTTVKYKQSTTLTIAPADGYKVVDVIANGQSYGAVDTITFKKVIGPQTLVVVTEKLYTNPFTDISGTEWYADAVQFCNENGLMNGMTDTTFEAGSATTRAQVVTVLYRLAGSPETASAVSFFDVAADAWYAAAVEWASANEIVLGSEGLFNPEKNITREQLAAILVRYAASAGYETKTGTLPTGVTCTEWAADSVASAFATGYFASMGGDFTDMTADATRAEIANAIYLLCTIHAEG